jgi:hypothetical protein
MRSLQIKRAARIGYIATAAMSFWPQYVEASTRASRTRMRVARHVDVSSIPAATLTTAFTNATAALTIDDGSNDLACPITLELLDGAGFTFSGGNTTANPGTQIQYQANQANAADGYAVIVNTLNWCQSTGAVAGCGWRSGTSAEPFLVIRSAAVATRAGIVFAHEFGHTVGLPHDNFGLQIMDGNGVTTSHNKVRDLCLCDLWKNNFGATCPTGTAGTVPAICSPDTHVWHCIGELQASKGQSEGESEAATDTGEIVVSVDGSLTLEELAMSFILDTVPADAEDFYGPEETGILVEILFDKDLSINHRTAATLLGLISDGNEADSGALLAYAEEDGSDRAAAMMALGYIVTRHADDAVLDLVLEKFESSERPVVDDAALGLTLSGHPRARDALLQHSKVEDDDSRASSLRAQAAENERISTIGIRRHYAEPTLVVDPEGFVPTFGGGVAQQDR